LRAAAVAAEGSKIEEEYTSQRSVYEAFTENAYELLSKLLKEMGIEFASMEKRTKSIESLRGKVERGGKMGKYDSLKEITDLSGIRIIAFLKEDCKKISTLLSQSFVADRINSIDKEDEIDPDRFGYQSIHLILSYGDDRLKLPEFKRFVGLKFEVQVKTLLQHTWSTIDWKLRYKRRSEAPKKLRRRLFRISALLDAADDELSYVYEQVSDIKSYYANAISRGDLSLEIDLDSVDALLASRAAPDGPIAKLFSKLNPAPNLDQTKQQESVSSETFLPTLKAAGITELRQLDQRIKAIDDAQLAKFQAALKSWLGETNNATWSTNRFDMGKIALLMTAPVEVAKEILKAWPFNPVLTAKIKQELGIEEAAPEPNVSA
jgi:putative GTP pyrophosphokinase